MIAKWDGALTGMLAACALITTIVVVHREFDATFAAAAQSQPHKPKFIRNWNSQLTKGVLLGSAAAPVQLVEFADFECPYCGDFHRKLKQLRDRYPTQVSLIYVHLPLPGHRFALPAARVAECAGEQGRFEAMYDELFDGQDSFGLKPWSDYAVAARVPDLEVFETCIKSADPIPRVEEGKKLATELDVKATPTLIVNGWMLGGPPTAEELDAMVKAVLAGKSPVSGAQTS
jgi:protein-disulfide isomerase